MGNGQLLLDFTGELNDKMKGFYRSKYTGQNGQEQYCAVTQFEVGTTIAHSIFQCQENVIVTGNLVISKCLPLSIIVNCSLADLRVFERMVVPLPNFHVLKAKISPRRQKDFKGQLLTDTL